MVEKSRLAYWSIFLLVAGIFPIFIAIYLRSPWAILFLGSWFIFLCCMAYLRLVKKREPRYPLVPPEGKPDVYTRFGLPRPILEDFDEMKRKREKLEKLKRMRKEKKH